MTTTGSEFSSAVKLATKDTTMAKAITVLLKLLGFCQYIFCTATAVSNVDFQKICNSFPPFTTQQNLLQTVTFMVQQRSAVADKPMRRAASW